MRRLIVDLAIPETLTQEQETAWENTLSGLGVLKPLATRINAGQINEERTDRADWHICHNDIGELCEPINDI